jgi:hypothetical protein
MHIRIQHQAVNMMLGLGPAQLKILLILIQHADNMGVCFPSPRTMSDTLQYHVNTVYAALGELVEAGYVRYMRQNQFDQVTRKRLPDVYQVSPHVISLPDSCHDEALAMWGGTQQKSGMPPAESGGVLNKNRVYNQQQNQGHEQIPVPSTITNNNNHGLANAESATATPQSAAVVHNAQPAVQQKAPSVQTSTANTQQRGAPQTTTATVPRYYQNPSPVYEALEPSGESMSERLRDLGIPLPLARGLVTEYGVPACALAYDQTMAANAVSRSGFFRHILQKRLTDAQVLQAQQAKQDKYQEFMNVEAV